MPTNAGACRRPLRSGFLINELSGPLGRFEMQHIARLQFPIENLYEITVVDRIQKQRPTAKFIFEKLLALEQ